jgi:uncharacterized protein (TIGR03086 family)
MEPHRPPDAMAGGVAVLERAIAYALGSLALVTPPLLTRPTPCPPWTLGDLLDHLIDSMAALQEAVDRGQVSRTPVTGGEALIPAARDHAVHLLGAWTNAGGTTTVQVEEVSLSAPVVAAAGAIEVTVHGWDVARACGEHRPIPDDLAGELLDLSLVMVRPPDRPGRFGPPLRPHWDASAGDRLLAYLGRFT